jgi:O-antigen/teichoic acid export membrane protein
LIKSFAGRFRGASLDARFMRSSVFTLGGYGMTQVLRLASNLILTRLLFPEAFGMMALVLVIIQGLAMFSDVGVSPAIMQSKRGDDQKFLDTAWTIQVIRGVILWIAACGLAVPMAKFYEEPLLAWILPVAGISLFINGFNPTRLDTANRHLLLGRITGIDLSVQVVTLLVAVILAWFLHSVWALVISGVLSSVLLLITYSVLLPGERNRFLWEKDAATELISFGKWIFLSTICGFLYAHGDKLLLGKYLTLEHFGIYNIGFILASFPLLMGGVLTRKVLIPLYRERPPTESAENFRSLQRMRFVLSAGMLALAGGVSLAGVVLIDFLYQPVYAMAGGVVVLIAAMQMPQILVLTYEQAALASGDSRRFFIMSLARAVLMIGFLFAGLNMAGLFGALIGQGVAAVLVYPFVVWLARHSGAWDPKHDAVFVVISASLIALSLFINYDAIIALASL